MCKDERNSLCLWNKDTEIFQAINMEILETLLFSCFTLEMRKLQKYSHQKGCKRWGGIYKHSLLRVKWPAKTIVYESPKCVLFRLPCHWLTNVSDWLQRCH